MLFQVVPLSRESKGLKAILLEVMLHIGSANAMIFTGIKSALDRKRIGGSVHFLRLLLAPVLHHHGDAGSAATVLFLLDKWNVQPDARRRRKDKAAETQNNNDES